MVDTADSATLPIADPESELSTHRRELGELVLYELSPFPLPHFLDLFYVPEEQEGEEEPEEEQEEED